MSWPTFCLVLLVPAPLLRPRLPKTFANTILAEAPIVLLSRLSEAPQTKGDVAPRIHALPFDARHPRAAQRRRRPARVSAVRGLSRALGRRGGWLEPRGRRGGKPRGGTQSRAAPRPAAPPCLPALRPRGRMSCLPGAAGLPQASAPNPCAGATATCWPPSPPTPRVGARVGGSGAGCLPRVRTCPVPRGGSPGLLPAPLGRSAGGRRAPAARWQL